VVVWALSLLELTPEVVPNEPEELLEVSELLELLELPDPLPDEDEDEDEPPVDTLAVVVVVEASARWMATPPVSTAAARTAPAVAARALVSARVLVVIGVSSVGVAGLPA